jgi:hypothetical protein
MSSTYRRSSRSSKKFFDKLSTVLKDMNNNHHKDQDQELFNNLPKSIISFPISRKTSTSFSSTKDLSSSLSVPTSPDSISTDVSDFPSYPPYMVPIPARFRQGISLLKVTHKKIQKKTFWLKPEEGKLVWESGSLRRPNGTTTRE